MSPILLVLLIAALVWKPIWAFSRARATKDVTKQLKYQALITEWRTSIGKVLF